MSYDMIDRFLRNNLGDDDYAEYSAALDALCTPQPKEPEQELVEKLKTSNVLLRCHRCGYSDKLTMQIEYTTPPQRKPLTHEQRVDLLAKFEAHKHEWHAPAILIDMVEAAHGITGDK